MNSREILSTPGPITGASKRACVFWSLGIVVMYLATLYALAVWNTWNTTILIVLLGPLMAMMAAGIQAAHNGSVLLSFILTIAPVLGTITTAYRRFGNADEIGYLVVMALFAGATAHLLGFEFSKPRDGSVAETWVVAGILVVSGAAFVYIRFPGFHEVGVAGILVVFVTGMIWLARRALY